MNETQIILTMAQIRNAKLKFEKEVNDCNKSLEILQNNLDDKKINKNENWGGIIRAGECTKNWVHFGFN